MHVLVTPSPLTLCDPMDYSPPGFSVHGILLTRILMWVAFPSPGDLPNPGTELESIELQVDSLPSVLLGKLGYLDMCYLIFKILELF